MQKKQLELANKTIDKITHYASSTMWRNWTPQKVVNDLKIKEDCIFELGESNANTKLS